VDVRATLGIRTPCEVLLTSRMAEGLEGAPVVLTAVPAVCDDASYEEISTHRC